MTTDNKHTFQEILDEFEEINLALASAQAYLTNQIGSYEALYGSTPDEAPLLKMVSDARETLKNIIHDTENATK